MSHQSPGRPGKILIEENLDLEQHFQFEPDLKEIPVDVLTGGGELLLLRCGQEFVNILHTSSLFKIQVRT